MSSETPEPAPEDEPAHAASLSMNEDATGSAVELQPSLIGSSKIRGWHQPLLGSLLLIAVCYVLLWPIVTELVRDADHNSRTEQSQMPLAEAIELHAMKAFAVLWVTALGGTVGSFLNVVAYRMPRGKSVIFSPSRCPKCDSDIRPTDNIPVFGWLRLEGKCRVCSNPISPQYPIVEAIIATIFLLLFGIELVSGGANIPLRLSNASSGIVGVLFELRWDIIQLFLFHCGLFCLLVSWVLVDLDRQNVTWLAIFTGILLMAIPVLFLPHLLPVPVAWPIERFRPNLQTSLLTMTFGSGAGLGMGLLFNLAFAKQRREQPLQPPDSSHVSTAGPTVALAIETNTESEGELAQPISDDEVREPRLIDYYCVQSRLNLVSLMVFLGIALGWQAVVATSVVALGLRAISLPLMNNFQFRLPLTTFLLIGALLHHLVWRQVSGITGQVILETSASFAGLGSMSLIVLTMITLNRFGLQPVRS